MELLQAPPLSDNSIDSFIVEVTQPTTPAMDGTPIPDRPPVYQPPPPPPPMAAPQMKEGTPLFSAEDMEGTTLSPDPQAPVPAKRSGEYKDKLILGIIDAEEFTKSRLLSIIDGSHNPAPYKYTAEEKSTFATLMEPFKDIIAEKCPAAVPLFLVYAGVTTDQAIRAAQNRKTNRQNRAGRQDGEGLSTIAKTIATAQTGDRRNWLLYVDGYYRNDRQGTYIKRDGTQHSRLEKPNIKDMLSVLSVPSNNKTDLICAA